jgi:probable 2-oxoglutarate dehydrogenase E1 component DHKTD1
LNNYAFIRIEELCPFPAENIQKVIEQYPNATEFIWAQEEHRNMGAWSFVSPRFDNIIGKSLKYIGRDVASTVAGTGSIHSKQAKDIINDVFN